MQSRSEDRDFADYNAAQARRPVRPLAQAALAAMADPRCPSPVAIELGCGIGVEARHLAEDGLTVHAYDVDPSVAPALEELAAALPVHPEITDLTQIPALPEADLVLSCAALPFVRRTGFDHLWDQLTQALRPGGILAVDLFGDRDDWAGTDGTYLTRTEVEALLECFEILELLEEEKDGRSFSGPKHWHTYRILARRR